MHAIDVMTSEVISVDKNATVPAVAKLLAERGISAVPVVDKDNRVIGMVSEGDLLHRAETGTERRRAWWLDMMASTNRLAGDYIKSHSVQVKDVMTRNVLSVTETDERTIRGKLLAELKAQKWAEVSPANVIVKDGVVHLWSSYVSEQEKRALVVAAENIPGVRRVEDHMRRVGTTLLG